MLLELCLPSHMQVSHGVNAVEQVRPAEAKVRLVYADWNAVSVREDWGYVVAFGQQEALCERLPVDHRQVEKYIDDKGWGGLNKVWCEDRMAASARLEWTRQMQTACRQERLVCQYLRPFWIAMVTDCATIGHLGQQTREAMLQARKEVGWPSLGMASGYDEEMAKEMMGVLAFAMGDVVSDEEMMRAVWESARRGKGWMRWEVGPDALEVYLGVSPMDARGLVRAVRRDQKLREVVAADVSLRLEVERYLYLRHRLDRFHRDAHGACRASSGLRVDVLSMRFPELLYQRRQYKERGWWQAMEKLSDRVLEQFMRRGYHTSRRCLNGEQRSDGRRRGLKRAVREPHAVGKKDGVFMVGSGGWSCTVVGRVEGSGAGWAVAKAWGWRTCARSILNRAMCARCCDRGKSATTNKERRRSGEVGHIERGDIMMMGRRVGASEGRGFKTCTMREEGSCGNRGAEEGWREGKRWREGVRRGSGEIAGRGAGIFSIEVAGCRQGTRLRDYGAARWGMGTGRVAC